MTGIEAAGPPEPAMSRGRNIKLLAVIICVAAGLRLYTFAGYVGLDDAEYARLAHSMLEGAFGAGAYSGPAVFPLRVGIIAPAAASFGIFGVSGWSMVLPSLIVSLLSIMLVYTLATRVFDARAGLIAAALWALLPLDLQAGATTLLPDLPAAFYASVAVACILAADRAGTTGRAGLVGWGVLAGLMFGLSWLCKESVAYFAPFVVMLAVARFRRRMRHGLALWSGVAVGAAAVLLGETIIYHASTGDWLFRAHQVQRNQLEIRDGFFTEGSRWGWPRGGSYARGLLKRLFVTGPQAILLNAQLLYLPLVGVLASAYALFWKERSLYVPALWLLTLCFMFNFATSHFAYYAPLALFGRYLFPIAFPAVIVVSGFLSRLLFERGAGPFEVQRERLFWGTAIAMAIGLVAARQTLEQLREARSPRGWAPEARVVSSLTRPSDTIYTDRLSQHALEFYWRYPADVATVNFEGMKSLDRVAPGALVFVHPRAIDWLTVNSGMWLTNNSPYEVPDVTGKASSSWSVVWQGGGAALYRVQ